MTSLIPESLAKETAEKSFFGKKVQYKRSWPSTMPMIICRLYLVLSAIVYVLGYVATNWYFFQRI
jgi:hypothetical protein